MNVKHVTQNGGNLIAHMSDGTRHFGYPVPGNMWIFGLGLTVGAPTVNITSIGYSGATATAVKGEGETPDSWSIQVSTNQNFTTILRESSNNPYSITGLQPETTYYVRASAGLNGNFSEYSSPKSFTTTSEPAPSQGFAWPFPPNEIGTEWEGYPGHKGVDWPRAAGTDIKSAQSGTVEWAGWYSTGSQATWWGWGYMVVVNHGAIGAGGAVLRTLYAHMNSQPIVYIGQNVSKGQVLGYVGTTGDSSGNHLHWETSVGSMFSQINPRTFMVTYGE